MPAEPLVVIRPVTSTVHPAFVCCVIATPVTELTNNRAYSAILQAPPGLPQQPREFAGFEEFVQSTDMVSKAVGGPYLGSLGKVTYRMPSTGRTFVFKDAASIGTVILDMGIAVAKAIVKRTPLRYASCILDAAAHSQAATLNEAPGLVDQCFPALLESIADLIPGLGWIRGAHTAIELSIQKTLILGDAVFDTAAHAGVMSL